MNHRKSFRTLLKSLLSFQPDVNENMPYLIVYSLNGTTNRHRFNTDENTGTCPRPPNCFEIGCRLWGMSGSYGHVTDRRERRTHTHALPHIDTHTHTRPQKTRERERDKKIGRERERERKRERGKSGSKRDNQESQQYKAWATCNKSQHGC